MDTDIRPVDVIIGALSGIGSHLAKRCTEYGFDLVVAAAIGEAAANFRVPGVSIDYGRTPPLRPQVIAA
jgi:NAD(P)-dependent dehydrogenase (short-subunit alcohol dehydrogenase family)